MPALAVLQLAGAMVATVAMALPAAEPVELEAAPIPAELAASAKRSAEPVALPVAQAPAELVAPE